jgi:hypothetical protein
MRPLATIIVSAILATGFAACSADAGPDDPVERAKFIASSMSAITPKDLGHGYVLASVNAEGATLQLRFEGLSNEELSAPDFDAQMQKALCADSGFRGVVEKNVALEVNMFSISGQSENSLITEC